MHVYAYMVCACVCTCECEHMHAEPMRQAWVSFLSHHTLFFVLFFEAGLLTGLELIKEAKLAAQQASGTHLVSTSSTLRLQVCELLAWF